MRVIPRVLVAVVALMMCTATAAVADRGHDENGGRGYVVPANRVGGSSGGDLIGDWFAQILAIPESENPFVGKGEPCLHLGRHGQVLAPAGGIQDPPGTIDMTCSVQAGQPVFIVGPSADCSSAEPVPFKAVTAWGQRKCALRWLFDSTYTSILVSVRGSEPVDIHDQRFLTVSPQRRTVFDASEPIFGAAPGARSTFVAAGYSAEVRGLRKGDNLVTLVSTGSLSDGSPFEYIFNVTFTVSGGR